ncbi:hypothetical protein ABIE09_004591 [Lysobacter enzymogenes]|uniref:hypothetical protein n=1 Tax=Lysobacter enzymogenes TaxID=69 RepID=UPI003393A1E6
MTDPDDGGATAVYRPRMRIRNASWFDHRPGADARAAAMRSNPAENSERHRSLGEFGSVRAALARLRVRTPQVRGTARGRGFAVAHRIGAGSVEMRIEKRKPRHRPGFSSKLRRVPLRT